MLPSDVLHFISSLAHVFLLFKIFPKDFNILSVQKISIVFILTLIQSVEQRQ